jgi:hypothetical protein
MRRLIFPPETGDSAALARAEPFAPVHLEYGAVTWPGEFDLAPDAMHREIQNAGSWMP